MASRPGALPLCAGLTQTFSQSLKTEWASEHLQRDPFFVLIHTKMATKGNAIRGHTAHHIHIDATAEITVFIDDLLSQR